MKWDDIKNCKIKGVVPVRVKSTISGTITYGTGLFSNEGFEMATFLNKTTINKNEPDVIIQFLDESIPSHKETKEGEKIEVLENGNKAYKASIEAQIDLLTRINTGVKYAEDVAENVEHELRELKEQLKQF